MQLAFAAMLAIPLLATSGKYSSIFQDPVVYFRDFGLIIFTLSLLLFLASYFLHTTITKFTTGFSFVEKFQNRRLESIVENLARTAGLPIPKIGIIHTPALNSFACGLNPEDATIVVTQGLLEELNDDELQAVIAHEIVHIQNGDIGMMAAANASHSIIKIVNWVNPFQIRSGKMFATLPGGCIMVFLLPIIIPLIMILAMIGFAISISTTIAGVTRYFITSSREFIADAEAVRLTHNPAALISALSKIEGRSLIPHLDRMSNAMMIDGPMNGEYASHPPIFERVEALTKFGGSMIHGAGVMRDSRGFGQRPNPDLYAENRARDQYRQHASKNIVDRVNHGSGKNALNIPTEILIGAVILGGGFLFLQQKTFGSVADSLGRIDPSTLVQPIIHPSPAYLVLDLDGDGVETSFKHQSGVFLDFNNDGYAERTGWLGADDGFLFLDKNNNHKLDGLSELVQVTPAKAKANLKHLATLSLLDSNRDDIVDKRDQRFHRLKIWRDLNGDGAGNADEIYSMDKLGILSLSVKDSSEKGAPDGYEIASNARFIRESRFQRDPSKVRGYHSTPENGKIVQISFETDRSKYRAADGQVKTAPDAKPREYRSEIRPSVASVGPLLTAKEDQPKAKPETRKPVRKETPPLKLRGARD